MIKIILKNMNIYQLHRSNEKDHEKGRPAILLKYKSQTSLIWWGTHKKEKNSDEKPLILRIDNTIGYFYSKGIEKVENKDLKDRWIDYKTNDIYELNNFEQRELISAFSRFTNQKDPYQKITLLELENQMFKDEIENLRRENELLKQEKELKEDELELEID